jgi:transmembrane 9 superfamily protein 2/4
VNSIVIALILTSMVSMILVRALHRDISRYNNITDEENSQEDFGWKMVHADVFRPPSHRMLLSIFVGTGAQLVLMTAITLVFATLGFLSPSSRGALGTMVLIFYVLLSAVAGYVSSLLYKSLQGELWRKNVALSSLLLPGIVFAILLSLNFALIHAGSSAAVPFGTLVALMEMGAAQIPGAGANDDAPPGKPS